MAFPAIAQAPKSVVEVIAAPVKMSDFSDQVEALGNVRANETVNLTVDTMEKVTEIHFEDGQTVKKGDLLVSLNNNEEAAELRAAQAQLQERQSAFARAKSLQQTSALSKATLQERSASLQQIEAEIESIVARIEQYAVIAPFDGILGLREISVGALLQPGDLITTIDDLSRVKVDFDVPSLYLANLKPGLVITGRVEAYGDRTFEGVIDTVNTQVDPVTRTVRVRAIIPNGDGLLKPGLLMSVTIFKQQREALLIPEESLIKRGDENFVYVVRNEEGKTLARETKIQIGSRQPGVIEVLSGLSAGDQVVTHGIIKISDSSEVSLKQAQSDAAEQQKDADQ
jgi:membrane fusion protein (multidrug efflux system)